MDITTDNGLLVALVASGTRGLCRPILRYRHPNHNNISSGFVVNKCLALDAFVRGNSRREGEPLFTIFLWPYGGSSDIDVLL